jgi:hypothetical protein
MDCGIHFTEGGKKERAVCKFTPPGIGIMAFTSPHYSIKR